MQVRDQRPCIIQIQGKVVDCRAEPAELLDDLHHLWSGLSGIRVKVVLLTDI